MAVDKDKKAEYDIKYAKEKLKRIPLDVTKEKYQEIKDISLELNETVNGFIKKSIDLRIKNETDNRTVDN